MRNAKLTRQQIEMRVEKIFEVISLECLHSFCAWETWKLWYFMQSRTGSAVVIRKIMEEHRRSFDFDRQLASKDDIKVKISKILEEQQNLRSTSPISPPSLPRFLMWFSKRRNDPFKRYWLNEQLDCYWQRDTGRIHKLFFWGSRNARETVRIDSRRICDNRWKRTEIWGNAGQRKGWRLVVYVHFDKTLWLWNAIFWGAQLAVETIFEMAKMVANEERKREEKKRKKNEKPVKRNNQELWSNAKAIHNLSSKSIVIKMKGFCTALWFYYVPPYLMEVDL